MTEQLVRDIAAVAILTMGIVVVILEFEMWRTCTDSYRWVYLVKIMAGVSTVAMMGMSLLRLYGGTDIIDARVGRPVFLLLLLAMALGALHNRKVAGGC